MFFSTALMAQLKGVNPQVNRMRWFCGRMKYQKIESKDSAMKNEIKDSALSLTEPTLSRFVAYVMIVLSGLLGGIGQTVLIFFLFFGSLTPVNLNLSETAGICLNLCLCLAVFLQHSVMIRKSFRRWMERFISTYYHGALFTIVTGIALLMIVVFWQKSSCIIAAPQGILHWVMRIVALLAVAGTVWTFRSLDTFDPFGLNMLLCYTCVAKTCRPHISITTAHMAGFGTRYTFLSC